MRKIAVVTTFNKSGLDLYGQKMINSFIENWPKEITLYVYAEKCNPSVNGSNVIVLDADEHLPELTQFKEKWRDVPTANGVCPWPERRPKDHHKTFKWDAIRFSHKVYCIFKCAETITDDVLIWMDADTICHSTITIDTIEKLIPSEYDICYLGRENKWPECGLYSMNLRSNSTLRFLSEFKRAYTHAEDGIFKMEEWHDSYVFDEILKMTSPKTFNWSAGIIKGEGHPLINSAWGAYLDHLKGGRKITGKSNKTDIVVNRSEEYWKK
jgi:hypothetical protein